MEVLHFIADVYLKNLVCHQWYILLLLCIQMSGYNTATTTSGTYISIVTPPNSQSSSPSQSCNVTLFQSCPCNSTWLSCTGLSQPLTEIPKVEITTITHLDLTSNAIRRIESASFLGLEFLVTLCLGHNVIDFIDPQAFSNLYRLETLNLQNNEITNLDPSGRTFQHLASLKFLNLQNNLITKVNKYSFLTMASFRATAVTVKLENNPIQCDCDVWALRHWLQPRGVNNPVINLNCNEINRSYLEVPESSFGTCNDSTDGIFSGETYCPICAIESTNNGCNLQSLSMCPNVLIQPVCHKSVTWSSSSNVMGLSSGCISYDNCLSQEAENVNSCGLDYQANKSVACHFCCKGPTCGTESIGGRTKDFTFYLSLYANIPNREILNSINSTISEKIGSAFGGIVGGIDGNLYALVLQNEPRYRVVLQLHVTTFSTVSESSLANTLTSDVYNLTNAYHLYDPELVEVTTYFEGLDCDLPADKCPLNMICTACKDETTRCLCDNSSFYHSTAKTCSPLTKLQVREISVSSIASDTIVLNWTADNYGYGKNVTYAVRVTPESEQTTISVVTSSGAVLSGLDPGTAYNVTITSKLTAGFYERLTEASVVGVRIATHGSACDPNASANGDSCIGDNLQCMSLLDGSSRCLCSSGYYYKDSDGCRNVTELQVKNVTGSSSNVTVTLRFEADTHGTNVTYRVQVSPLKGQVVAGSVSVSGAQWSGLDPGTMYNFTVLSTLPASSLYIARNVSSEVFSIWTKFAHGMVCSSPTATCATDLSCQQALDGSRRCLCNDTSFYLTISQSCLPVTKLQVSNLSVLSSTNNSIRFAWTANKFGTNVTYKIWPSPYTGQVVASSLGLTGAEWTGLVSGSQYNFTVTATLVTDYYSRSINTSIWEVWTKAVHGNSCTVLAPTNGKTCTGSNVECQEMSETQAYCVCSSGYFFSADNTCRNVNELRVENLNASSITNDTVTLSWTADKHGRNVSYIIKVQPHTGQVVPNSFSIDGRKWTGLRSGTQYNFSVTSFLPADNLYGDITLVSQVLTVWTKELKNVTIIISYIKQNAEFQPFMLNSSSEEYLKEAQRIINGVTAVLVTVGDVVSVRLLQFTPLSEKQYQVDIMAELITFDAETIGQMLNDRIQNNTQDTDGFLYKEHVNSLEMAVHGTDIQSHKCPYSVTSLDKGGIKWSATDVGLQYSPCPYNNPLDHPKPMATRNCSNGKNELPVWGDANTSLCITKEEAEKPNILEVFQRNITKDNAEVASVYLRMITNSSDNLTAEMVNKSVLLLEILTTEEMLQQPNVATNVIDCVNNLINVNMKTLLQSEMETRVASRLLHVIDSVANKAPLTEGKLKISTPNLAVAAQKIDDTETRDITLVTSADIGNESDVNIDVSVGGNSQLTNTTSLVIPVMALINSLNNEQKQNLKRISFIVQRSDILFSVIRNSGNTARPNDGDKDDNRDHNHGVYSNDNETRTNESYIVTKINSHVISASIPGVKVENLSRNITMNFEHSNNKSENARCMFWDGKLSQGQGDWSGAGCGVVRSDSGSTTCGCNHLTNFALLMDVYEQGSKLGALDRKILSIISYVGCAISCFALIVTLITYSVFKKLRRDNPSKILINLCLALLCSNLVFLLGMQDYSFGNEASCKAVAVLLHYFLLASLTWMAVEAFYMYLALVVVFKTYFTHFILKCSLVGWGVPLVIVIITLGVNTTDNYGFINSGMCWLKNPAFYAAFVGPVCLILLINCMAFILVVKQLASMSSIRLNKTERNSTIQRLRGAVGVVILLGLSWIFAIFAIGQASVAFYYLFAIFNSLQGLFIFIFYCLLKSDAVVALKRSLPCFEEYGDSTKSYSNSKGMTNTAAGHHLMKHKSGSSKKKDSSKGTLSTTIDSRKDSCFSTLSGSNIVDDKDGNRLNLNTGMINSLQATSRLLQSSHDISEDTSSNISTNSDKPVIYASGILEEDPERRSTSTTDPPKEIQDTSFSQHSPDTASGSYYNIVPPSTADPRPKFKLPSLSLPQTSNLSSQPTKSAESSSPCLKDGHQTDETPHPSVRADGEIDSSHLASVNDILNRLESNTPSSITDIDNNDITKPEEPRQGAEDDTSSNIPTNSDTPTRYFGGVRHDPDARNISTEAPIERLDTNLCENQSVTYRDYASDIPTPLTDDPLPIPSCLSFLQMSNKNSLQIESTENSLSCSLDPSHQTDEETLHPSFIPFRADGEIDYSHLESVGDIHNKFEWLSETSDKNVTKI